MRRVKGCYAQAKAEQVGQVHVYTCPCAHRRLVGLGAREAPEGDVVGGVVKSGRLVLYHLVVGHGRGRDGNRRGTGGRAVVVKDCDAKVAGLEGIHHKIHQL
eukprot:Mycagemm_TRINITY_DN8785_c0_g1::TRINITY_DN8785_c0_g1_i1::g.2874::m.2874 type:complete len:102 gc:universal TRINITY_DN8785_c0_g1_i1:1020-715(-)